MMREEGLVASSSMFRATSTSFAPPRPRLLHRHHGVWFPVLTRKLYLSTTIDLYDGRVAALSTGDSPVRRSSPAYQGRGAPISQTLPRKRAKVA